MEVNGEILLQQTISRILCAPQAALGELRPSDPNGDQHNNVLFKSAFLLSLFHFLLYLSSGINSQIDYLTQVLVSSPFLEGTQAKF